MTERTGASWLVYSLGALCAGAIAAAVLVVGAASGSQSGQSRTVTAAQGVVQSTVSGSGSLQPVSQLNLGFKTSGTVTHVYVSQGQQVAPGQLLATLNPQSAEVTLEQAKATLKSAEANLAKQQETNGAASTAPSSTGSASTGSGAAGTPGASTASVRRTATSTSSPGQAATPTSTAPTRTTTTTTTKSAKSPSRGTTTTQEPKETSSGSSSSSSSVSPATREANIASAKAAVGSDKLTVGSDEQAVQNTKLYAPSSGTIVSLTGQVGETVSGGGTTRASTTSSSSGGSSGAGTASSSGARSGGSSASSGSSGSTGSSSSAFAVLGDLSSMQVVAPLSESEVGHVKVGQIATVTVEALEGRKLAAHVSEVAILSTSNGGVVSYDVTFKLDQTESGLKPGMSATAEAVVKQAEGVNVPTSAISAGTVTVVKNGKQTRRRVVTGLAGNSSTIILSGLNAGEVVALPISTSTTSTPGGRGATGEGRAAGAGPGRGGAFGGGLGGGGPAGAGGFAIGGP